MGSGDHFFSGKYMRKMGKYKKEQKLLASKVGKIGCGSPSKQEDKVLVYPWLSCNRWSCSVFGTKSAGFYLPHWVFVWRQDPEPHLTCTRTCLGHQLQTCFRNTEFVLRSVFSYFPLKIPFWGIMTLLRKSHVPRACISLLFYFWGRDELFLRRERIPRDLLGWWISLSRFFPSLWRDTSSSSLGMPWVCWCV